ncbi:hypothetical protein PAXRUDRAFT_457709 [Paxillus rubicundulus Ve08.2h10]|uniref:Uncharacterized protein n=1 Tax=Paxillus rubicundulus Ve08.2h10 TaxID=930991 RepID=A0A0D0E7T6_9AGAM|nr:hypothetical protein PAXRUDRAFT_457709 [Paxillus rubicundulus Ve08.2h10]
MFIGQFALEALNLFRLHIEQRESFGKTSLGRVRLEMKEQVELANLLLALRPESRRQCLQAADPGWLGRSYWLAEVL